MKKRGREKRGMKKALPGPARRTAQKKPERRAMIAAAPQRVRSTAKRLRCSFAALWTGKAQRKLVVGVRVVSGRALALSRRVDRGANRALAWAYPRLAGAARRGRALGLRAARRLRPAGVLLFRGLSWLEKRLLRAHAVATRAATRASAVLTPERAVCLAILGAAACLGIAQFTEFRAVELGEPGYVGLPGGAAAPTTAGEAAGSAHAYLLLPVAALAALLALAVLRDGARRGLGRIVFALGAISLAVALLVDLPTGLDAAGEEARFAGATAVLEDGFYAEIAAAIGLMLGGALLVVAPKAAARYHARPCRTRINLFARVASAPRRRWRRRASSRARGARRGSRPRSGAASAPASPR